MNLLEFTWHLECVIDGVYFHSGRNARAGYRVLLLHVAQPLGLFNVYRTRAALQKAYLHGYNGRL